MQSLLYLTEEAKAHEQNGKPNLALKKYMAIKKVCFFPCSRWNSALTMIQVFDEIEDDQYDFHGYNIRKFTVNIYLKYALSPHSLQVAT
jgi:N-alpha-acetyltransferase 15/16, NatA auxiliary subunit